MKTTEEITKMIKASLVGCSDVAKYIQMEKKFNAQYPLEYKIALSQLKGEVQNG